MAKSAAWVQVTAGAAVQLGRALAAGAPAAGFHNAGELVLDANAHLPVQRRRRVDRLSDQPRVAEKVVLTIPRSSLGTWRSRRVWSPTRSGG
jgi:hypothetical protein